MDVEGSSTPPEKQPSLITTYTLICYYTIFLLILSTILFYPTPPYPSHTHQNRLSSTRFVNLKGAAIKLAVKSAASSAALSSA